MPPTAGTHIEIMRDHTHIDWRNSAEDSGSLARARRPEQQGLSLAEAPMWAGPLPRRRRSFEFGHMLSSGEPDRFNAVST